MARKGLGGAPLVCEGAPCRAGSVRSPDGWPAPSGDRAGMATARLVRSRMNVSECVEWKVPVIPVLWPGVQELPARVLFSSN